MDISAPSPRIGVQFSGMSCALVVSGEPKEEGRKRRTEGVEVVADSWKRRKCVTLRHGSFWDS